MGWERVRKKRDPSLVPRRLVNSCGKQIIGERATAISHFQDILTFPLLMTDSRAGTTTGESGFHKGEATLPI